MCVEQKTEVCGLLYEFRHIFSDLPGKTDLIEHHIELTTQDPIRSKPFPIPYHLRDKVNEEIESMLSYYCSM